MQLRFGPIFLLAAILLVSSLSGCYQLSIQSARNAPVQFNTEAILAGHHYQVVRHFYHEEELDYVFGANDREAGLLNQILQAEAQPGDIILNLKIRRNYTALDAVISLLTLGIYARSWLIVEGDIVKI